ncbi:MAG: toll/interleukin-1 receptor domain-containing protein [Thermoguttaceae bacterium]
MLWQLRFFPACTHHVFLSHCREDREWLVFPLFQSLQQQQIIPWLDHHDYPYGRTSFEALRDGILKSRHTVFLVTSAMLTQPRSWGIIELAWADLLQENLREAGGTHQSVILPLFFLSQNDERLLRSAWQPIRDRAHFHTPQNGAPVDWAVREIREFLARQAVRGADNLAWLQQDSRARDRLNERQGLVDRIIAVHPTPAPALEPA